VVEQTLTLFQVGGWAGQHVRGVEKVGTARHAPHSAFSQLPSADCPPSMQSSPLL
jgi:hypothetical protein